MLATAGIPDDAKILIHDAVRPFVEQSAIDGSIDALDQFTAATVAYASTDTVLLTEDLGDLKVVKSVPDRPEHLPRADPAILPLRDDSSRLRFGCRRPGLPSHRRHARSGRLSA